MLLLQKYLSPVSKTMSLFPCKGFSRLYVLFLVLYIILVNGFVVNLRKS